MFGKQKVAMIVAEFFGTAVLASVAFAILERTTFPLFVGTSMATVYGIFWLMFSKSSGAHFNPVVTVGLWTLRKIQTAQAIVFVIAQALGGLAAWRLIEYLSKTKLTNIAGKQLDWRILVAEALGALVFGMGIAAALYNETDDLKKALIIAGSLFLGVNVAALGSNALLNPAVALGVRSLSWSYGIGSLMGAVVGMNLYAWLFSPNSVTVAKSAVARSTATKVEASPIKKTSARKKPATKKSTARKSNRR